MMNIVSLRGKVCHWLETIEIHGPKLARLLCQIFPARCPFERDLKFFGYTVFHIPPLCKLNPFYEQVVGLRFKALSYLSCYASKFLKQPKLGAGFSV